LYRLVRGGTIVHMDTMPSAEFRKRYPRLKEGVHVTVNGHIIGTYFPDAVRKWPDAIEAEPMRNVPMPGDAFHQEPWSKFTPVPKPTRRK
jgi:hypothetical protein